jgi:hypothetical protein
LAQRCSRKFQCILLRKDNGTIPNNNYCEWIVEVPNVVNCRADSGNYNHPNKDRTKAKLWHRLLNSLAGERPQ